MITLKEFVRETLNQIVEGVEEFRERQGEAGATVFPKSESVNSDQWSKHGLVFEGFSDDGCVNYSTLINFDVAVSASEMDKNMAGGGIKVVSIFRVDGAIESEYSNTSVSRISFKVPLRFPGTKENEKRQMML